MYLYYCYRKQNIAKSKQVIFIINLKVVETPVLHECLFNLIWKCHIYINILIQEKSRLSVIFTIVSLNIPMPLSYAIRKLRI